MRSGRCAARPVRRGRRPRPSSYNLDTLHPPDPFAHRYTKLRLIGRGGFGAVYRAWDAEMDGEVALKLLNADLAADSDWRKRFRLEATAARKLNHPNITIVYDRGEFQGQPFIVMELVEGKPLSRIIDGGNTLTVPERVSLLEQLCDGLHYAHQRDILHRDIKPVNLLVRDEHDGTHLVRRLKILDFGIAKIVNSGQTGTGNLLFTPNYVSPEQVRGLEVDRRSDLFAVGAVAYELLVSEKAFVIQSKNPFAALEEVKRKIVELPHRPMTELQPDIDPELVSIVDRALSKEPDDRYSDLAAMRRHLRHVRERLEEALISSPDPTVVLSAKSQAVMRLVRKALDSDAPTEAVRQLEAALAEQPSERERRFFEQSLEEARARQAARGAPRRAPGDDTAGRRATPTGPMTAQEHEAAAQELIKDARQLFSTGLRTAALARLEQFAPPHAAVAAVLSELRAQLSSVETDGLREDAARRQRAMEAEAAVEEALAAAPSDQRLVNLAAAIRAARSARQLAADGDYDQALAELEKFSPAELVAPVMDELRSERLARDEEAARKKEDARPVVQGTGETPRQTDRQEPAPPAVEPKPAAVFSLAGIVALAVAVLAMFIYLYLSSR